MEPRAALTLWRWPLAVVIGIATMTAAALIAGVAFQILIAMPHWGHALLAMSAPLAFVPTSIAIWRRRSHRKVSASASAAVRRP